MVFFNDERLLDALDQKRVLIVAADIARVARVEFAAYDDGATS